MNLFDHEKEKANYFLKTLVFKQEDNIEHSISTDEIRMIKKICL